MAPRAYNQEGLYRKGGEGGGLGLITGIFLLFTG